MFLEPFVLSLLVGKLRKGRLRNLENTTIKAWYLLIIAGLSQLLIWILNKLDYQASKKLFSISFPYLHGLSYILIIFCIVLNIRKHSMKLLLIGTILNFLVIFSNGGQMPVDLEKVRLDNNNIEITINPSDIKHKSIDSDTRLVGLADIILIGRPYPLPKLLSIGDIFLMAGLFLFIQEAMKNQIYS